jgi:hypothetical protein
MPALGCSTVSYLSVESLVQCLTQPSCPATQIVRNLNVTKLSGTPPKSGRCQRFRKINMTKASRTRAPKFEAEINSSDIFKIVATIIVLLVVGAMGALYLGIMT